MRNHRLFFVRIDLTHKTALILVILALLPGLVSAQSADCGSGVPCGPLPWRLPVLPKLASPTPMPTTVIEDINLNPGPGTPTNTPQPTGTPYDIDTTAINDQVATLNAIIQQTPMPIYVDAESTEEVDLDETFTTLGTNAGSFFGYVRGLDSATFGPLAPLVSLSALGLAVILTVKITTFLLPFVAALFGIIRKIVNVILEFIPL